MDQEIKNEFENLARMIHTGFQETATKQELQSFRKDFLGFKEEVNQRFEGISNQIDALHSEFGEIKVVLPPLVRSVAELEAEVMTLRERISRIEKKVGLST